jgi:3'(2'), 5'-bisphosphate nucleotidase
MTRPFYKIAARDRIGAEFAAIATRAGEAIMAVYHTDFLTRMKADETPVTLADQHAEDIIVPALQALLPGIAVISEESCDVAPPAPVADGPFVLVDPLDGTREFIARNGEFTVNIALIDGGAPVAGCVYAPAVGELYFSGGRAWSAGQRPGSTFDPARAGPIEARQAPLRGAIALASRSHRDPATDAFLASVPHLQVESVGSSLKFCRIAAGRADLYARFGPTMEWDVAAGHAILQAAGGSVSTPDGAPFNYGKFASGLRNGPFIARGRSAPT